MSLIFNRAAYVGVKIVLAATIGIGLSSSAAFAQSATPVEGVLEWAVGVMQGNMARSFAVVMVCFLGFLAMTGKMAWMMAFAIILGIALVFGASTLVDSIISTAGG